MEKKKETTIMGIYWVWDVAYAKTQGFGKRILILKENLPPRATTSGLPNLCKSKPNC